MKCSAAGCKRDAGTKCELGMCGKCCPKTPPCDYTNHRNPASGFMPRGQASGAKRQRMREKNQLFELVTSSDELRQMIKNTCLTVREFVALAYSHLSGQGSEASNRLGPLEEHLPPAAVREVLSS